ncbi:MAG: VanZ family protein [Pseudomonadota bacterium]
MDRRFFPMVVVMAAIFLLSHTPGDDLPAAAAGMDKLCHAAAYGALAATMIYAVYPRIRDISFFTPGAGIVLFCLFYGITDEFHQSFIPGRFPSWQDIVADGSGALLVVFFWQWWGNRRRRGGMRPVTGDR